MKTSELSGAALDWAVWTAAGGAAAYPKTASGKAFLKLWKGNTSKYVHPSTDWSQGGPIIEREEIEIVNIVHVFQGQHLRWRKSVLRPKFTFQNYTSRMAEPVEAIGPTPLVAAMRCFVASKLGDEVDVPDELQN